MKWPGKVLYVLSGVGLIVVAAVRSGILSPAATAASLQSKSTMGKYVRGTSMNHRELTAEEKHVILNKGTERPFSGKYTDHDEKGFYACRQCGALLYRSDDKFKSHCGWPSFDDEIKGAVKRIPDADGRRTEIVCANCDGHLGHVFLNEGFTSKNTRHCVNSISLDFLPPEEVSLGKAVFAGGCFWGVEYWLQQIPGVLETSVGFSGGHVQHPTYRQVCETDTGHAEAIEITYDTRRVTFEDLARAFFEVHDPTQKNRQGPDVGSQYRSAVYYVDDSQKAVVEKLIGLLREKGLDVQTEVAPFKAFWPADLYHQDYYNKQGSKPYCHAPTKRF